MATKSEEDLDEQLTQNPSGAAAATIWRPITTYGELFSGGMTIELIRGEQDGVPQLMFWDGASEIVGSVVEHNGRLYEPPVTDGSVLRELMLPARPRPHGSTRELLGEICGLVTQLVGLDEKSASLVGRIVLCSHLLEAVSVAPMVMIIGPDTARGNRLMALLRCLCRHSLPLTGVTPAGFCSLPSGARFTYLISQTNVSDRLRKLLDDASSRDQRIPFRGRLLDLFGVQVVHSESVWPSDSWPLRSVQISMIPTGHALPAFDFDAQRRITEEFQARLLSFRRANLGVARKMQFDTSKFTLLLRDLARSIAAATPDDPELQAQVFDLLREEDAEIRSDKWIDLSVIAAEAVLVAHQDSPGGTAYVAEIAQVAEEISRRRGQETLIEPAVFGRRLRLLGFATQRDAKGKKLRLTEAVRKRAEQLVGDLGGSEVADDRPANTSQEGKEG